MILARLLMPDDFGLVALATAIVAGIELLTAFNFDVVLISEPKIDDELLHSTFSLSLILSFGLAMALCLFAVPVANFMKEPRLAILLPIFGLNAFLQGGYSVGLLLLRKNFQFRREFIFLLTKRVIGFCATVGMAFWFRDYRALIVGVLTASVCGLILSYVVHPYRPRFQLTRAKWLFGKARSLLLTNVIVFAHSRLNDLLVGRLAGNRALGIFSLANDLATLFSTQLTMVINRVSLTGFSEIKGDPKRTSAAYVEIRSLALLILLPAATGMALVADLAVAVLLGEKWLEVVAPLRWLAFASMFTGLMSLSTALNNATGDFSIVTRQYALLCVLTPLAVACGITLGNLPGAAMGLLLVTGTMFSLDVWLLKRLRGIRISEFWGSIWRPALGCLVMWLIVVLVKLTLPPMTEIFKLVILILVGGTTYVATVGLLWLLSKTPNGAEERVLSITLGRIRRKMG